MFGRKRIKDPVRTTGLVVAVMPEGEETYLALQVGTTTVQLREEVPAGKLPAIGSQVPVVQDRDHPDRVEVAWDEVTGAETAGWSVKTAVVDLSDGMSDEERAQLGAVGITIGTPAVGGGGTMAADLERLAALHASGALTDAEFAAAKARLLGT